MRIALPEGHERLGALRIHGPERIVELDSALDAAVAPVPGVASISAKELDAAHRRMTIVVPIKNERRSTLRGVLTGIPGGCRVVVVSASERRPVDRVELERDVIQAFVSITGRFVLHVHQADPRVAALVTETGFTSLVEDEIVRPGKGEAMILGVMAAHALGSDAVGFIDADNYVPGAVNEYVRIYAATLHQASSTHLMSRISWQSKPKIEDGELVFNRWGRSTAASNRALNEVLSHYLGEGTSLITTGNAGEHMMTIDLARHLRLYGSFAAETGEWIDLMEQFGGIVDPIHPELMADFVDVHQTETINPHFHEDKGEAHVDGMRQESLSVVAGSPICPPSVARRYATEAPAPIRYPPLLEMHRPIDAERLLGLARIEPR